MTPIHCPTCGTSIPVPPPERVVAYLGRAGWSKISSHYDSSISGKPTTWEVWRLGKGHPDDVAEIEVPMRETARDYPRRYFELLHDLARAEGRAAAVIAEEMGA